MKASAGRIGLALAAGALLVLPAGASALPTPLSLFGSQGAAAGQLDGPSSVAIDGAGNIYVGEQTNHRISVFTPGGTFVRAFGRGVLTGGTTAEICTAATTCQIGSAGSGAGELETAGRGMAVDAAGQLYVAESVNNRISVFNPDGSFVRAFGWGVNTGASVFEVCTTSSECQAGLPGGGSGQLSFPVDVEVDGAGNLYVADSNNNRISVFNPAGPTFLRAFGLGVDTSGLGFETCTASCETGLGGGDAGSLSSVTKVAINGAGRLYAIGGGARVNVFDVSTQAVPAFVHAFGFAVDTGMAQFEVCTTMSLCQNGTSGTGAAGQLFSILSGIAVDSAGSVSVVESQGNRMSVFNAAVPSFVHAFGWGVDNGMAQFEVCTVTSTCQIGGGGGPTAFNAPLSHAVDCRGTFWIPNFLNENVLRIGEPGAALPPCTSAPPPTVNPPAPPAKPKKKCKKGQKLRKGRCVKRKRKKK